MACPQTVQPTNATALARWRFSRAGPGNASWSHNDYANSTMCGEQSIIIYALIGITAGIFVIGSCVGIFCTCRNRREDGPRITARQPRRSRANGIAQAVLKALPVVRFGVIPNQPAKEIVKSIDLELNAGGASVPASMVATGSVTGETLENDKPASESTLALTAQNTSPKAAATQYDSSAECSICTEDYHGGEEVRVLPCNHKFHPECVDPWLLNISGTCPLCRLDLHERHAEDTDEVSRRLSATINSEPPMFSAPISVTEAPEVELSTPSERLTSLSRVTFRTLAGHIAALREHRQQRTPDVQVSVAADERSLTSRVRAHFKIRTIKWQGRTETFPRDLADV